MKTEFDALINALRDELNQYGEMLALLDQQQHEVVDRSTAEMTETVAAVNRQRDVIRSAREIRGELTSRLAEVLGLPGDAELAGLKRALPDSHGILLGALVEENNELLTRVRQRARQNHLLLTRSLELMQQVIGSLFPQVRNGTYAGSGMKQGSPVPTQALYEAVG